MACIAYVFGCSVTDVQNTQLSTAIGVLTIEITVFAMNRQHCLITTYDERFANLLGRFLEGAFQSIKTIVNFGNKCPQNEEIICQSLMSDDQTVASRINQFRGDRLCVIDGQQTFDLAEEPIDQAEITA